MERENVCLEIQMKLVCLFVVANQGNCSGETTRKRLKVLE